MPGSRCWRVCGVVHETLGLIAEGQIQQPHLCAPVTLAMIE
jgi:hypothetical protein